MALHLDGFVAYPSALAEVRQTLGSLPAEVERRKLPCTVSTWETNDIAGYCLVDPILEKIKNASFLLADITRLNFNVVYEVGYAIGKGKRAILLRNKAIKPEHDLSREFGIFDTVGHTPYENVNDLCHFIGNISSIQPLRLPEKKKGSVTPFFIAWPNERTESEIRLGSCIKKQSRLGFIQFDPQEDGRLPINRALESVVNADGIILPLISLNRNDAEVHNLRCAFLAGLAHALDKETLILQAGGEPVPLDYRDAVCSYTAVKQIDLYLADFTPKVFEKTLQMAQAEFPELTTPIQKLQIGQSAAENEHDQLGHYYIQTEEYQRVLRGEIQIVTGRKGSGKTALFYQVRNKIRVDKRNIVLDLNPEGFQLKKLKKVVLENMEAGTREHTITAFWEYILFLELCYKLLEKDKMVHLHNHVLRPKYLELQKLYRKDLFISEGDFAERLLKLVEAIEDKFASALSESQTHGVLSREKITEFLYQHDLDHLRGAILDYLEEKGEVWILFDNIDKGWNAHGVDESDLMNLRCLIEALRKLSRDFRRSKIVCNGVVFIRNDVYEILVGSTPDRGKLNRVSLDWTDPDLLCEMLRRRFIYSLSMQLDKAPDFQSLWGSFAVTHLSDGTDTANYVIARSLMRPRSLLDFLHQCKSHAVNLGHSRLEKADFIEGEKVYSTELVNGISLEIQDVMPEVTDALFAFIESSPDLDPEQLTLHLEKATPDKECQQRFLNLLFWYGFLGFMRKDLSDCYIYTVNYDMRKFNALLNNISPTDRTYLINPAFYSGLEIATKL